MEGPLTIRPVDTDEDCKRTFLFLCDHMLPEVARVTIEPNRAFESLYRVCNNEAAWIVENEDGEIIASAGVVEMTGGLWYGIAQAYLTEKWLFVRKDCRKNGRALALLLREIKDLAEYLEVAAYLRIYEPEKDAAENGTKRGHYPQIGYDLAYTPAGRMIVVQPPRGAA
jgi:GNAT superfamily N-acetyltransferase